MIYIIDGQEIAIDNKLAQEYERAMGMPLTDLKMRSIYETVIDDCKNAVELRKSVAEIILEYIEVAKDMPNIIQKIENGIVDYCKVAGI